MTAPVAPRLPAADAYQRLLLATRARGFQVTRAGLERLETDLQIARRDLLQIAQSRPGTLTGDRAAGLRREIGTVLTAMETRMAAGYDRTRLTTVTEIVRLHGETAGPFLGTTGTAALGASYERVATEVLDVLAARRGGTAHTFRTLYHRHLLHAGPALDSLLTAGIARGQSIAGLTTAIVDLLGGLDPTDPAFRLPRLGGLRSLRSDARRIARSETMNAMREANDVSLQRTRMVAAVQWTLNSAHHIPCDCEDLARANRFNFGPGMYPPGSWPLAPHPNCGCYQGRVIMKDPSEWGVGPRKAPPASPAAPPRPPDPSERLPVAIRDFERHQRAQPVESAMAVDRDGNVLLDKLGQRSQVEFTPEEMARIRGAEVFTHNHPSGGSFSNADAYFIVDAKVKELRAVGRWAGREVNYSMRDIPARVGDAFDLTGAIMNRNYLREYERLLPKYQRAYRGDWSVLSADEQAFLRTELPLAAIEGIHDDHLAVILGRLHTHEVMEAVARNLGFTYEREIISVAT